MLSLPFPTLLAPDVNVWLVYSGTRRRFFPEFIENSAIFLDLPGFDANEHSFESVARLRQHIRMADAIRDYYRGHRQDHPGRRLTAFSAAAPDARTPEGRRFNAELGNATRLFQEAKVGDVILSPPMGHYDPFLIGRISSDWHPDDVAFSRFYIEDPIPIRRVSWIRSSLSRRDFPRKIARALQNPHAISLVERDIYFDIFLACFDSFIWENRSKLDVFGNTYSSHDPLETYEAAFIIKYFASAFAAYENGNIDDFNSLPLQAAIARYFDPRLLIEFRQNFNSPGRFALAAAAAAMAFAIGAGIVVISDDSPAQINKPQVIQTINEHMAPGDPGVANSVTGFVQALSPDRLDELNDQYGSQARAKIGMSLRRTEVAADAVQ